MARVTGPLLSLAASGTIQNTITYATWKGRPYARMHVIPSNPKTAAQVAVRAMLKFLSQGWSAIKAASESSWVAQADATKTSTFNAYISANLKRWREFQGPTQISPAAEAKAATTITMAAPAGGPRNIEIGLTPTASADQWGIAIFRDTAEITTANWNKCIAIVALDGTNQVLFTDSPLDAGTYHYRAAALTADGVIGTACADQTGTAT